MNSDEVNVVLSRIDTSSVAKQDGLIDDVSEPKNGFTRKQWVLMIAFSMCNFWMGTGYAMLAPFFPQEAEKKGASPTVYGLIIGFYQVVVIIMSPVFGKLAPIVTPNLLAYGGIFLSGSASILFGVLEWCPPGNKFIVLAILVRCCDAMGWASYFTSSYTIIAMKFEKKRATVLSLMETLFGLGMITGPTLGGALYQVGGYYLPFITLGSLLLCGSLITFLIVPPVYDVQSQSPGTLRKLLKNPTYVVDLLICASCMMALGFNDATLEPHLRQFHLEPVILGTIFIVLGGIYALGSPIWGYLCDKTSNILVLCAIGITLSVFGYLLIGPAPFIPLPTTIWLVCIAQLLLGLGMGGKLICAFIHAMRVALDSGLPNDVTTYGAVFGSVTSASSLGAFIGPSLGGFLLEHVGYRYATLCIACIELVTAILVWGYAIYQMRKKRKSLQENDEEKPLLIEE